MELKVKVVVGVCLVIFLTVVIAWMYSDAKMRQIERVVDAAKREARVSEEAASTAERSAGEYKKKIEYLETELAAIGQIARRQDEELEKISGDVSAARSNVERARGVRAINATADELCAKLAELGHGCR